MASMAIVNTYAQALSGQKTIQSIYSVHLDY